MSLLLCIVNWFFVVCVLVVVRRCVLVVVCWLFVDCALCVACCLLFGV